MCSWPWAFWRVLLPAKALRTRAHATFTSKRQDQGDFCPHTHLCLHRRRRLMIRPVASTGLCFQTRCWRAQRCSLQCLNKFARRRSACDAVRRVFSRGASTLPSRLVVVRCRLMVHAMLAAYTSKTPQRARVVDAFLACILVTALAQAAYGCVITTFPYYSYLAGIFCTLGMFALTGMFSALRWRWSSPHRCAQLRCVCRW